MEMKYQIQLITELEDQLLEGPVYDKKNNFLYFVSILEFRAYRFHPQDKHLVYIQLDSPTSCIFLSPEMGIVAATSKGFYALDFELLISKKLFTINIQQNLRFNDGILDAQGRFLIGTMGYPEIIENAGSLLSYSSSGEVKTLISGTTISNGISFTKDSRTMFFIDTPTRTLKQYSYDLDLGACIYVKDLIYFSGNGLPDGMDSDINGNLWIAEWGGYRISVWDSITGKKLGEIPIPSENITSLCFDCFNNLYVTAARSEKETHYQNSKLYYIKFGDNLLLILN
jgi:sugar lactone lactonase YvrE